MPSPSQVANRTQPPPPERHRTAIVTGQAGSVVTVTLDPGGASTTAAALTGAVYAAGTRVLVLMTAQGNFIVGGQGSAGAVAQTVVDYVMASVVIALPAGVKTPIQLSTNGNAPFLTDIPVPSAGLWLINGAVCVDVKAGTLANPYPSFYVGVSANGASPGMPVATGQTHPVTAVLTPTRGWVRRCAAGDTLRLYCQPLSVDLATALNYFYNTLSLVRLGA